MEYKDIRQLLEIAGAEEVNYKTMVIRMMKFSPERFLSLYNERPYEPAINDIEHIEKLKIIVKRNGGNKIGGIKEISEYCRIHNFEDFYGLREAKEFFEANV